ncbi:MAG: MBL fold metallo-hydrolase [Oscillospiraceae bacterium]|nr:MBL fold metallo-hydrolase [Oscillospiraceae bacterium]
MKKTYVTTMPNHIGAFLKASRCFAGLGINITRVSYNKAIDTHTLFIDAEGTPEQLKRADIKLGEIGYLQNDKSNNSIVLIEFRLKDEPGSVTDVLSLINEFNFNISYISSQENGTDYQLFKMGLYVDDAEKISVFLAEAEKLCRVRVIDYNHTEKIFDNSIFYNSFVQGITSNIGLSDEMREKLLVNTNLAMQTLDEKGTSPYRTFDSIGKFAELIAASRGERFSPRISRHKLTENTELVLIEPPCGSNTAIIKSGEEALFIDTGYSCYREEMEAIFRKELPNYSKMKKTAIVTHADLDHAGLLYMFDEVFASKKTAECLKAEYEGRKGFRETNPLHEPYINICKILTGYQPPEPYKVKALWGTEEQQEAPLVQIGFFDFADLHFEVYEGKGGHLQGEIVLIDYAHNIVFTGDIYINLKGLTSEQAAYNRHAPILMTSVDTDPKLCALERQTVIGRLGSGNWQIFGAHGYKKDYSVNAEY